MIKIIIPGVPVSKRRPRFARRGKFVVTYNDQETEEGRIRLDAYRQLPDGWSLLKCSIKVTTIFFMKRPQSHYGTGKNKNVIKKSAPLNHITKPDIDNLQKTVYDCLNSVVWADDSQICESLSKKTYSDHPRTEIFVEIFENG